MLSSRAASPLSRIRQRCLVNTKDDGSAFAVFYPDHLLHPVGNLFRRARLARRLWTTLSRIPPTRSHADPVPQAAGTSAAETVKHQDGLGLVPERGTGSCPFSSP